MPSKDPLEVMSSIVDKMVENQTTTTAVIASFKEQIEELRKNQEDFRSQLRKIEQHFTNGFRSELKKHISEDLRECQKICKHNIDCGVDILKKKIEMYKSFGFWIRVCTGFIVAVGGISVAVYKIVDLMGDK